MLDARRQEVWTAAYGVDLVEQLPAQPLVLQHDLFDKFIESIPAHSTKLVYIVAGNGAKKVENAGIFENVVFSSIKKCSAQHLASLAEQKFQLADFQDTTYFEPFYMKKPNITTPNKPLL